jgi:phage FluMu gp28-like protein
MNPTLTLPETPQEGWRIASQRPDHARAFKGAAKAIPESDQYWVWYQHRWVHDQSLLRVMRKSRRVGISYSTAYDYTRQHAAEGMRWDSWVSSRDLVSALEFHRYCKSFSRALHAASQDLGAVVLDEDKQVSAQVLHFANGTRIHSLTSNPDAMASKGGNVAMDEFDLRTNQEEAYAVAQPTIMWGGRLSIITSVRNETSFFNQRIVKPILEQGNPMGWSLHTVTLQTALDQGFLWKLQTRLGDNDPRLAMDEAAFFDFCRSQCADEETFLREYMCQPSSDDSAFLPYDLIFSAEYPAGSDWEVSGPEDIANREYYCGLDVGRVTDLTVLWIAEKIGGVFLTVKIIELKGMEFSRQEAILYPWLAHCRRAGIDASGLGRQFAERARQRFGRKIEEVVFTAAMKEQLAFPLRGAFEDGRVKIPALDKVRSDLRLIKKTTTAAGNVRFDGERTADGHSDRFWALALCLHAGSGTGPVAMPQTLNSAGPGRRPGQVSTRALKG